MGITYKFKLGQTDPNKVLYKVTTYEIWDATKFGDNEKEWSGLYCTSDKSLALGYLDSLYGDKNISQKTTYTGYLQKVKINGTPLTILEIEIENEAEKDEFCKGGGEDILADLKASVKKYLNSSTFNIHEKFMQQMGVLKLLVECPHSGGTKELIVPPALLGRIRMTVEQKYTGTGNQFGAIIWNI